MSERPVSIRMSVTVSDGSFDSSLSFPIEASKEQINATVMAWLQMLEAAVKSSSQQPAVQRKEK